MYAAPTAAASVGVKQPPRMPPRMMTGAPSGAITRLPGLPHPRPAELGATMLGSRRTQRNTTMHSPTAISSAGTTEAANSAPVETAASPA